MLHLYKTADPDQGAELARPLPSSAVRRGSLYVLATEGTGQASVLDEPTPPLLPTVSTRNNPAAGQASILAPIGQRPLPCLQLQLTPRAPVTVVR